MTFSVIGQVVVGLIALAVLLLVLTVARDLIGYIYGAFRIARLSALTATRWQIFRTGLRNWRSSFKEGGGWYYEIGDKKVYLNGWLPIEDRDSWPA